MEINNSLNLEPIWDADTSWNLKDYATGEVKYSQRYRGHISNVIDLRNFPFDSDVLIITLGPRFYKKEKLTFEHEPDCKAGETPVVIIMEDWDICGIAKPYVDVTTGPNGHRNVSLSIVVHRKSGYYIWKVLLVNFLAGIFSWSVFIMPTEDIVDKINCTLTLYLSEEAFLFVIADKLSCLG